MNEKRPNLSVLGHDFTSVSQIKDARSRQTCAVDICRNQMTFIQSSAVKASLLSRLIRCHGGGLTGAYCPEQQRQLVSGTSRGPASV